MPFDLGILANEVLPLLGPLYALGFVNGAMLAGLAAASIPIILHLLNRRKFRERSWAAMRFLMAAIRKNQKRIRLEQLLLLAIRTMILVLIVCAMARPILDKYRPILPGQRTHRVIVLDGSLSMGYAAADQSRLDQAKALAQRLVKESRSGDSHSVVLMGSPPRIVVGGPSANPTEVSKEIGEIAQTHEAVDLIATFEAVERALAASEVRQKEVVFLTDMQSASWRVKPGGEDGLKRAVAKLEARAATSSVIDLGALGGNNRAITDLSLDAPVVTVGGPPPIVTATVKNFGRSQAPGVPVQLIVDGNLVEKQFADLAPGEERAISFATGFSAAGDHLIEVMIDDDPLKIDNHRWLALPVRDRLRVLLIDGDRKPEAFEAETDYLAQALDPVEDSSASPSAIKVEVASESQLRGRDLSAYDVVVLANVAQLTAEESGLLDAFLNLGGGLVVFTGDRVVQENYNRVLFRDGKGPLPARIGPTLGNATDTSQGSFRFDPLEFRHPIIRAYQGAAPDVVSGLTGVKTWMYHKLEPSKDSSAITALAFETGDPAVLEMPHGRGNVTLVATSADAAWGNWPLHPSYPPVMEQMIMRAAAGKLAERNVPVGQPLDQAFAVSADGAPVSVVTPASRTVARKLTADGDVSRFHFDETETSGAYRVKVGPPVTQEVLFSANFDPAESALDKLTEKDLTAVVPNWNFRYFDDWSKLMEAPASISKQGEAHRPLLWAVLVLLFVETVLAWVFGHHR